MEKSKKTSTILCTFNFPRLGFAAGRLACGGIYYKGANDSTPYLSFPTDMAEGSEDEDSPNNPIASTKQIVCFRLFSQEEFSPTITAIDPLSALVKRLQDAGIVTGTAMEVKDKDFTETLVF